MTEDVCAKLSSPFTLLVASACHTKEEVRSLARFTFKAVLLQIEIGFIGRRFGEGFTVMLKFCGLPEQVTPEPVNCGVTTILEITADELAFMALKGSIFPVPVAFNPMDVWLFVQLYEVPVPTKLTIAVGKPLQTTWSKGAFTAGVGLTVNTKF